MTRTPAAPASRQSLRRRIGPEWAIGGLVLLTLALLAAEIVVAAGANDESPPGHADLQGIQRPLWCITALATMTSLVALVMVARIRRRDRALQVTLEQGVRERTETLAIEIEARRLAETELRSAQARLNLALDAAATCTWDCDVSTGRVLLDSRWSIMRGGEAVETHTTARALVAQAHPDDRRGIAEHIKRCVDGHADDYSIEHRVQHQRSGWMWIASRGRVIARDARGRGLRVIGTNTDITARKSAEETSQRQMAFLAALNKTTIDLLDRRAEGELLQIVVERMAALFRAPHAELALVEGDELVVRAQVGRLISAAGERSSRNEAFHSWRAIDSCAPVIIEDYARMPNVSPVYQERGFHAVALFPILQIGRCIGLVALLRDEPGQPFLPEDAKHGMWFTQLAALVLHNAAIYHDAVRTAETRTQQLRENEARFRAVFDQSPIPILLTAPTDARIVEANAASLALFGYAREEVIGHTTSEIGIWAETPQRDEYFRRLRTDGKVEGLEATMRTKGGAPLEMLCTGSVLTIDRRPFVLSSAIDITARKQAEAARSKLEQSLRQTQKMESIGTLAGGIAHDFNNVLTGLFGFIDLARLELPAGHPALGWLDQMATTSKRARDLVRQILTFSRRNEGERRAQRLHLVVDEALRLLRSTIPAMVDLKRSLSPLTPPALVDATQIHQVIMNLCTNAWHALPESGGRITVTLEPWTVTPEQAATRPDLHPGTYARLSVSDTGCGMTPAVAERVFEPFFTTKEAGKGSGLGLAVVHGIVQSHGGAILLHTAPGRGTTFEMYFPAIVSTESAAPVARPSIARGQGERILLVDDDHDSGMALEKMMSTLGYRVRRFDRASDLLLYFRSLTNPCDAVVADLAMPGLTGDALGKELLRLRPTLPILILSGFIEPARQQELEKAGIRLVARKPLAVDELSRHLRTLLAPTTATPEGPEGKSSALAAA